MAELVDLDTTDANNTDRFPENQAPSSLNNGARALEGMIARYVQDVGAAPVATLSGSVIQFTANQSSLTLTGTTSNYRANLLLGFTMGDNAQTGVASINANTVGPISLRNNEGNSLSFTYIQSGSFCLVIKDGTNDYFRLIYPQPIGNAVVGASNTFTANQTIQSSNAGSAAGPTLTLHRNSASPAANDAMALIRFDGEDSADNQEQYAALRAVIIDPTSGSEDGRLQVETVVAGTFTSRFRFDAGMYSVNATGGDQGADTINVSDIYDDGFKLTGAPTSDSVATTSGTSQSISSLATVHRFKVLLNGVSTSSTEKIGLRIGPSGGVDTSGYDGRTSDANGNELVHDTENQISLGATAPAAGDTLWAAIEFEHLGSNKWYYHGTFDTEGGTSNDSGKIHGEITLSGAMDQVQIRTEGTDTFDAGTMYTVSLR